MARHKRKCPTPRQTRKTWRQFKSESARLRRWSTSLHEAGHVVAGEVLTPQAKRRLAGAVVVDGNAALAYPQPGLQDFHEAVMIAAGRAAEQMADCILPPSAAPKAGVLGRTVSREIADALKSDCADPALVDDVVALARWAIQDFEDKPELWLGRVTRARYHAQLVVREHARRVVAGADLLYVFGVLRPGDCRKIMGQLPGLPPERFKPRRLRPAQSRPRPAKEIIMSESLREQVVAATKRLRLASREWRELLEGIRTGVDPAELGRLGAAACLTVSEVVELGGMVKSLPRVLAEAAQAGKLEREWRKIESDLHDAEARLAVAPTLAEQEPLAIEVERLRLLRNHAEMPFLRATQARDRLPALRAEGLVE